MQVDMLTPGMAPASCYGYLDDITCVMFASSHRRAFSSIDRLITLIQKTKGFTLDNEQISFR